MKTMAQPTEKVSLLWSQRLVLTVMMFLGNVFVYTARVNLSFAILCMVRSDVPPNATSSSDQQGFNVSLLSSGDSSRDGVNLPIKAGTSLPEEQGEFDWDKSTVSRLHSMYFYGYIWTQIPGGWLATKYGGRRVWGVCMFVSAVCSLLTPISARTHIYFLYVIRLLLGFSAGVTFPCIHSMLGRWLPLYERSRLAGFAYSGNVVGLVIAYSISGVMCEFGFDNGWGSIFYLTGIFYMVWVIGWFVTTADTPELHPRISEKEKVYIRSTIGIGLVDQNRPIPWRRILMSVPLWGIFIAHFCNNYTNYTLLTSLPTFMKESLHFDIKQNGVLSALPYLINFIATIFTACLADFINERGWLRVVTQRKMYQTISFLGTGASLCIAGLMDSRRRYVAVFLLCLANAFNSTIKSACIVNHLDLAPSFSGITYGISNTVATIPGIITPIIAGALTPNRTPEEWRTVFYLCGAVCVVGAILYCLMAQGELQEWAKRKLPADVDEDDDEEKERISSSKTAAKGLSLSNNCVEAPLVTTTTNNNANSTDGTSVL